MGVGTKRICRSCNAKFYDLEKDPIVCPKCGEVYDPETANKPKRGRKKAAVVIDDIPEADIDLGLDEVIEELDEDAEVIEELDEGIREDMEGDTDGVVPDEDKLLVDLEDDQDDIIDSGSDDKE